MRWKHQLNLLEKVGGHGELTKGAAALTVVRAHLSGGGQEFPGVSVGGGGGAQDCRQFSDA